MEPIVLGPAPPPFGPRPAWRWGWGMGGAAIGIDFGTTNTVVALAGAAGDTRLVEFAHEAGDVVAFRSALSFHAALDDPTQRVVEARPLALDAYLGEPPETRFIQSFQSYAAHPLF